MRRVLKILLNVLLVLVMLLTTNARPVQVNEKVAMKDLPERLSRRADVKNLEDQQDLESLPALQGLLQGLPQALQSLQRSAGRQSRDLPSSAGNSNTDTDQDEKNDAVEAVEAAVAKVVGDNLNNFKVKRSEDEDVRGNAGDNQFIFTVVDRNVVVVDGQNNDDVNDKLSDDSSRGPRAVENKADEDCEERLDSDEGEDYGYEQEDEECNDDLQEANEDGGDLQDSNEEGLRTESEDGGDVNDESEGDFSEDSETDEVPNVGDQVMEQGDNVEDTPNENEGKGKNKREILTKIEKTLSDVRSIDDYLEYLNKRADQLEELQHDLGKSSGNRKEEAERSKRESTKFINERPVDYLKTLPQYRDVPREVLVNAVQSLTGGDRLGRHLEQKDPVQRQACSTESSPPLVSPCTATKEPLTKEEQELQRVIELRKKHEANVAKEQDEVVKAEHMAHTLQQDMQEVMSEIRQLKKEISIERKEAEAISIEVKEDQKDLEEHDQKKFNARRHVDELYMKLTELESSDCEARSKRQLVRQMREIVGNERLNLYDTLRQRTLRELKEKEREQAALDRMRETMREQRLTQDSSSDVQDAQKQVREMQKSQTQDDNKQISDDSKEAPRQQDQQQAEDADSAEIPSNELVQRSVNAQAQVQVPAAAPAGSAAAPAMPRQAASECTTPKNDDDRNQYNAILQEIIIGEAKVKIEAVEVERAETEVGASRKRMSTALSHLSALVMELKNLQARAVIAGKKAKEAHLVLAYHDQLLFSERRKVTEALNLETDLQKMISDIKTKTGKCNKERQ